MAGVEVENNMNTIHSLFQLASIVYLRGKCVRHHLEVKLPKRLFGGVKRCCKRLLRIIEKNSADHIFDPQGDRRRVYSKVKKLQDRRWFDDFYWDGLLSSAIRNGHVECLTMADEMGYPLAIDYYFRFISSILCMKPYNNIYGIPVVTLDVCSVAAYFGQLECLEYAHRQGVPWDVFTCVLAVLGESYRCLTFAVENGCPLDRSDPVEAAVTIGNLRMLKYLHQNQCPWSSETCTFAALSGQLECLKYARDHGCSWNVRTCTAAVRMDKFECLKYAVENGCPMTTTDPTYEAAMLGRLDMLKYLHEHGCPWSESMCIDVATGIAEYVKLLQDLQLTHRYRIYKHKQLLECLVYAWKNGCPWPNATCLAGSGNGRMDCLLSEPDHQCMWDSEKFGGYANVKIRKKGPITSNLLEFLIIACITEPQ
ncbi:hypothetical protein ACI65C_007382 [Semiaphis heraclei]